jgi:hypothetical protein
MTFNNNKMEQAELNYIPSLFTISEDLSETLKASESLNQISKVVTKTSLSGINYKTLGQFTLMIIQLISQILILIRILID